MRFAALTANRVEVVRRLWSDEFDSNEPVKILGDTTGPPKAPNELVRIYRTSPSRVRPARQPDLRVEIRFPVDGSVVGGVETPIPRAGVKAIPREAQVDRGLLF